MSGHSIKGRRPAGRPDAVRIVHDPDVIGPHLEDAAHFPGGHATTLVIPESEAAIARALASSSSVLPIGAQSSLTGGATPKGEVLLSTTRLNRIELASADSVRVQAGVTLAALDQALEGAGRHYPPGPTFDGAFIGGTVATNAAGAETFKYGTTREWVDALTVVLPTGDVLDVVRGTTHAHPDGYFDLELARGTVRVPAPGYRMPNVRKLSAGYFAGPAMDLVDLFIGSEGTLGIVTGITLRVLPVRPRACLLFVPLPDVRAALRFAGRLREAAASTWSSRDPNGIDVSAIEHMDERSLALVRQDGLDRANGVAIPDDARIALLVRLELPPGANAETLFDEIGRAGERGAPDGPLVRFLDLLSQAYPSAPDDRVLDNLAVALPGDRKRLAQLDAIREAVPAAVNRRVGQAKESVDRGIQKIAADVVVPFEEVESFLEFCTQEFRARGLDAAVWGHISDGNLHPNVIPHSLGDVEAGKAAILEISREAIRRGGAPLAEHGVGRNPIKQLLLRELYGEKGIEEMRRIKRAIDPDWKLAPGVLFSK